MKNLNKSKLIILIIILTVFVRFYNFPQRINFSSEQGLALSVSSDLIKEKFSLIGQQTFLRTTSKGHIIFSGALYNYSLIPFLLIFHYNPVPITAFFTLLNVFTAIIIFIIVKKIINQRIAFLSLILFSFNSTMIFHSMFIWILNYLPLIGIISVYLLWSFKNENKISKIFLLGIMSGIGLNLEHFYLFTIGLIVLLITFFAKSKLKNIVIFIIGLTLANTTSILFDLKHDFYQIKTLWQYLLDTILNPAQSQISYYHFIQYWPLLCIFGALFLSKIIKINRYLGICLLVIYLFINLKSSNVSFTKAVGMSDGMNYEKLNLAAKTIASDNPRNFNIVNIPDRDFRAYSLRYLVKDLYNKRPEGLETYEKIQSLYVFAKNDFSIYKPQPWEISVFGAGAQKKLIDLDKTYSVFKLTKEKFIQLD